MASPQGGVLRGFATGPWGGDPAAEPAAWGAAHRGWLLYSCQGMRSVSKPEGRMRSAMGAIRVEASGGDGHRASVIRAF
jgi:hypothetical protein